MSIPLKSVVLVALLTTLPLHQVRSADPEGSSVIEVVSEFVKGPEGWSPGFSDFTLDVAELSLMAGLRSLPRELGIEGRGYYMQGTNRSDDLFMYLTRKLTPQDGIVPSAQYAVEFEIQIASDAPAGAAGVGGAPGESVYLKAGASPNQPVTLIDEDGHVRINIDKGNQAESGQEASNAGNMANGRPANQPRQYVLLKCTSKHPHTVSADPRGNLWLIVGTDSGFEAQTAVYYSKITVRLRPKK